MSNGKMILLILLGVFLVQLISKGAGLLIDYHFQSKRLEIERRSAEDRNTILADYARKMYELTANALRSD